MNKRFALYLVIFIAPAACHHRQSRINTAPVSGSEDIPDSFLREHEYDSAIQVEGSRHKQAENEEYIPNLNSFKKLDEGVQAFLGGDLEKAISLTKDSLVLDPKNRTAEKFLLVLLRAKDRK